MSHLTTQHNHSALAQRPADAVEVRTSLPVRAWQIILATTVALTLAIAQECRSITNIGSLRYGLFFAGWWGLLALGIWNLGKSRPAWLRMNRRPLLVHTAVASYLGVLHLLFMAFADYLFSPLPWHERVLRWGDYMDLNRWGLEMLVYGFIFGVAAVARLQLEAQQNAFQALELQRALAAAQLHALQAQVEPHFLFNTLNSITELVESGRQQQATEMLQHLNTILKTTLRRSAPQKISLAQELDVVENYLAIEQVRFADRLRLEFRIDPSALNALVPSFLLQPLMETRSATVSAGQRRAD